MLYKDISAIRYWTSVFKIVDNRPAYIIWKRQGEVFFVFICVKESVFSVQLIKLNSSAFISLERIPILAASRQIS